jgi:GAF domain-containing protein
MMPNTAIACVLLGEQLAGLGEGEAHATALRAVNPRSIISVPLLAHADVLGAITLLSCGSARRYGAAELDLAQDLARRSAPSIENARLFATAERAARAATGAPATVR